VAGLLAGPFVRVAGTDELLYVISFVFAAMAPIPRLLARSAIEVVAPGARDAHTQEGVLRATAGGVGAIRENRLVAVIAAMLLLGAVVTGLIDYGLKTALQERFSKDEMAVFLGWYQALVNALILGLQVVAVGRVLVTYGVRLVFALLPAALLAASLFMAVDPVFPAIVAFALLDLVLRYTFQNAATEMVLTPVPTRERNRAKVVMKGVTVPLGGLLAGLLLLPLRELWPDVEDAWRALAWLCAGLVGVWLYYVIRVKNAFLAQLQSAVGLGHVVLGPTPDARAVLEADGVRMLVEGLEQGRPEELRFSMDLLATGLRKIPLVKRILAHPNPRVRAAALLAIGEHRLTKHRRRVLAVFSSDRDPEVLRAALSALRRIDGERALAAAARLSSHPHVRVRAEALAALARSGAPSDRALARATAEQWVTGTSEEREMAAYLVGELAADEPDPGIRTGLGEDPAPWDLAALGDLLSDREVRVRLAAYQAVGRARARVYIPRLIQALSVREEARLAAPALRSFGAAAVPALVRAYRGRGGPRRLRLRIVQALGGIEVTDAVFALTELLQEPDAEVRRLAIRSLHRLKGRVTPRAFLPARFSEAVLREVRLGHLCFGLVAEMHGRDDADFFVDEVEHRLRSTAERIFDLCGLLYDGRVMRGLHRRYRRGPAPVRANTLELLENIVDPDLRRPVLRLLEDAPLSQRSARSRTAWSLSERGSFADTLLEATEDLWLQRCLL
jgi:HEAT repeat protein